MRLVASSVLLAGAAAACVLEPETCREDPSFDAILIPPERWVDPRDVGDASRFTILEDAGPDASRVHVAVGTKEEWLGLPCEEACRKSRREGHATDDNLYTTCSFEKRRDGGDWLRCNYSRRICTDYE